jgi:hypothetical protein
MKKMCHTGEYKRFFVVVCPTSGRGWRRPVAWNAFFEHPSSFVQQYVYMKKKVHGLNVTVRDKPPLKPDGISHKTWKRFEVTWGEKTWTGSRAVRTFCLWWKSRQRTTDTEGDAVKSERAQKLAHKCGNQLQYRQLFFFFLLLLFRLFVSVVYIFLRQHRRRQSLRRGKDWLTNVPRRR